jgi:class 3 adenylate cyclase
MGQCVSKYHAKEEDRHTPLELLLFPPDVLTYIKANLDTTTGSLSESFDYEKIFHRHHNVTVMFIDIVKFTPLIMNKDSKVIARFLHSLFLHIEHIKRKYPTIKKIETIGDCIVFTEGLFSSTPQPLRMIEFAEEILKKLSRLSYESKKIDVRIGIDIGEIGTCVVGSYAPRLCIFGDTVVYASRLQSSGKPNEITCSERFQSYVNEDAITKRSSERHDNIEMKGLPPATTFSYHHDDTDRKTSYEECSRILRKTF